MKKTGLSPRNLFHSILVAGMLLRLLFLLFMPAWQSPDEYAHYWVSEQIASTGRLPLSKPDDLSYEAYQPPLHYAIVAGLLLFPHEPMTFSVIPHRPAGLLLALRMISLACGVGVIFFSYRLFKNMAWLSPNETLLCTAFIAFLPTFVGVTSSVNNDSLTIFLATLSLFFLFRDTLHDQDAWFSGLAAGLALLTKLTALIILPAIFIWIASRCQKSKRIRIAVLFLLGCSIGWIALLTVNWQQYRSLVAVTPGVDRGCYFSASQCLWALRNLSWSYWLAFGRIYQVTAPVALYLVTVLPAMVIAAVGWLRMRRGQPGLFLLTNISLLLGTGASLWFTLSYPPGMQTSWGKNLYPLLPLSAIFMILGVRNAFARLRNAIPVILIALLLCGCLYGWLGLQSLQ